MRRRIYSDACGQVTVSLTPAGTCPDGKEALSIRVTKNRKKIWVPKDPLCLSPMTNLDTRKGRSRAFEDAVGFFEYHRCGKGRGEDE